MSFKTFVPVAWATELQKDLEKARVFAENTNRKYEGLVKQAGDSVKILGIGTPTVTERTDGVLGDVPTIEEVIGTSATMPINQVGKFNFLVDDLDKAQSKPKGELAAYMTEVRNEIAQKQDAHIASIHALDSNVAEVDATSATLTANDGTILDVIDESLLKLLENDVSRSTEITLTAPPWFTLLLKKNYVDLDTNNSEMMKNGRVGRYSGITIKESNNVYKTGSDVFNIQVKTNNAIAFVAPYIEMEAYRHHERYSDAVRGWALWQSQVVRPKEIINLMVKKPANLF